MGMVGEQMPSYEEKRRRLMEVIQENAIIFQDVQLFSNIKSQYYYDIKRISLQKEGAHLLAELLLTEIYKYGPKSVGGMEMGAVALVTAVVFKSTMDSIEAVNAERITPKGVVCVIDREEAGTPNLLKQNNIKYSSLFKHSEFRPFIEQKLEEK